VEESVIEYLKRSNITSKRLAHRYVIILETMHIFIKNHKLDGFVRINGRALKEAIIDYFVDTVRIKEFHSIKNTNKEKIYSYTAYWLLKRKPIQIVNYFKGSEFVNEYFVSTYLISAICATKHINNSEKKRNPTFRKFQELLYYNIRYRLVTQQSLELMIEGFFLGCDFK